MASKDDGRRRKPFSAKQRKEQLKAKRQEKRDVEVDEFGIPIQNRQYKKKQKNAKNWSRKQGGSEQNTRPSRPEGRHFFDPHRYKLVFPVETNEEIEKRKEVARKAFVSLPQEALEVDMESIHRYEDDLDIPKRPDWDYRMSKTKLEEKEQQYFQLYLEKLKTYVPHGLSYVELNIETWRQLWRVLEMSDIVLMIADIRFAAVHYSPALYHHVTKDLGKSMVLVLNKTDLVPPALVVSWKHYLSTHFPQLHVVCFSSFKRDTEVRIDKMKRKQQKRKYTPPVGPAELCSVCETIVNDKVDLSSWREKIVIDEVPREEDMTPEIEEQLTEEPDTSHFTHQAFEGGILTIGCCGYPNVGKSSLINALMGKKVVSVSRTPGHTKHFQTIFLTQTVRLCDCPGLVFPSVLPKPLQVLSGLYPIAQLREPYSSIQFLAERVPLVKLLNITHPEGVRQEWSAWDISEAWAIKRGFYTAKAARPDTYRAANNILRLTLEGRIVLTLLPPAYCKTQEELKNHEAAKALASNQEEDKPMELLYSESDESDSSEGATNSEEESEAPIQCSSNPFALLND